MSGISLSLINSKFITQKIFSYIPIIRGLEIVKNSRESLNRLNLPLNMYLLYNNLKQINKENNMIKIESYINYLSLHYHLKLEYIFIILAEIFRSNNNKFILSFNNKYWKELLLVKNVKKSLLLDPESIVSYQDDKINNKNFLKENKDNFDEIIIKDIIYIFASNTGSKKYQIVKEARSKESTFYKIKKDNSFDFTNGADFRLMKVFKKLMPQYLSDEINVQIKDEIENIFHIFVGLKLEKPLSTDENIFLYDLYDAVKVSERFNIKKASNINKDFTSSIKSICFIEGNEDQTIVNFTDKDFYLYYLNYMSDLENFEHKQLDSEQQKTYKDFTEVGEVLQRSLNTIKSVKLSYNYNEFNLLFAQNSTNLQTLIMEGKENPLNICNYNALLSVKSSLKHIKFHIDPSKDLNDDFYKLLSELTELETLEIVNNTKLKFKGFKKINFNRITLEIVKVINGLEKIKNLSLIGFSDEIKNLANQAIEKIEFQVYNNGIDVLSNITRNLPNLKSLDYNGEKINKIDGISTSYKNNDQSENKIIQLPEKLEELIIKNEESDEFFENIFENNFKSIENEANVLNDKKVLKQLKLINCGKTRYYKSDLNESYLVKIFNVLPNLYSIQSLVLSNTKIPINSLLNYFINNKNNLSDLNYLEISYFDFTNNSNELYFDSLIKNILFVGKLSIFKFNNNTINSVDIEKISNILIDLKRYPTYFEFISQGKITKSFYDNLKEKLNEKTIYNKLIIGDFGKD